MVILAFKVNQITMEDPVYTCIQQPHVLLHVFWVIPMTSLKKFVKWLETGQKSKQTIPEASMKLALHNDNFHLLCKSALTKIKMCIWSNGRM